MRIARESCGLEGRFALGRPQVNRFAGEIVVGLNHSDRATPASHENRVRYSCMPADANPAEQGAVTDSRRAKDDVFAAGKVRRVKDAMQVLL